MNKRVKELMDQPVFGRLKEWANIGPVQQATVEEFAESIVRECSSFLMDGLDDHFAAEQLIEHFGVKE